MTFVPCAAFALGCYSRADAVLRDPVRELTRRTDVLVLHEADGTPVPVSADSTIQITTSLGDDDPVPASRICVTPNGLAVRDEDATCANAPIVASWEDLIGMHVETVDGAATTLLTSGVVALVALAAYVFGNNAKPSSPSSTPQHAGHSTTIRAARAPAVHVHGGIGVLPSVDVNVTVNTAEQAQPPLDAPIDLFGASARRRAVVRVVLASEGGACFVSLGDCYTGGIRAGVRLMSLLEITAGAVAAYGFGQSDYARAIPIAGLGLHGEFPRYRWLALELQGEIGSSTATPIFANARFGMSISPGGGVWFSVYPIHPTYTQWTKGRLEQWVAESSTEIKFEF